MTRYVIIKEVSDHREFFAGYPSKFTADEKQARVFWSMRGARTARGHLSKRYLRAGQVIPLLDIVEVER